MTNIIKLKRLVVLAAIVCTASGLMASDEALLDLLVEKGILTESEAADVASDLKKTPPVEEPASQDVSVTEQLVEQKVDEALEKQTAKKGAVKVSHDKTGFKVESTDGTWSTNLGWRAQMRFTYPYRSDPRQVDDFDDDESTFELRRVRMKIGGHAYAPWLDYYFEVDLQPTRSEGRDASTTSSRLLDWRITAQPYEELGFRLGQWKIDYNRERVDSSGRQQFVERSIVNRQFTIDRQMGAQVRGRLFSGTLADLRYYVGAFTGQGRGVQNDDDKLMYAGRLQWNFLGRDLALRQTDVEFTEKPTGSISFGAATNTSRSTRWSSSGGGNLDGFSLIAENGQYEVEQYQIGSAFKYRGFSWQQEYHWKQIRDRVNNATFDMEGAYAQAGYFFHYLLPAIPKQLELAARYAFVYEPNRGPDLSDRLIDNKREEFTIGANWFIAGHNNKVTVDYSRLYLDDRVLNHEVDDGRIRVQWDVSF